MAVFFYLIFGFKLCLHLFVSRNFFCEIIEIHLPPFFSFETSFIFHFRSDFLFDIVLESPERSLAYLKVCD